MSKKILLVDDEPHIIRVMSMGLRREGYTVFTARNGREGLETFNQELPDAMIADVDMPEMNGVDMCTTIITQHEKLDCKIFISTSRAETELRKWANELGNIALLEKPISMRSLTIALADHFSTPGN